MAEAESAKESDTPNFSVLYFGYASNLSPVTLKQRCPDSLYVGMAVLKDWKIHINSMKFGNIMPSPGDVVYGALAFLSKRDEDALDLSEGVPWEYEKKYLEVTRVDQNGNEGENPQVVEVMTYIDFQRQDEGEIENDYIVWINKAKKDAVQCGVPKEYVSKYLDPLTPGSQDEQEIVMVRTLRSEVYNDKYASLYNPQMYDKTRGKGAGLYKAYQDYQDGLNK